MLRGNMPEYRVIYFDARGRAEPIRLSLAAAGQVFEDKRVQSEEWEKMKSEMPQGAVPILSVDGHMIAQSTAILRYIAREYDMYGEGTKNMTMVDTIISTYEDFFTEMIKPYMEQDEDKKKELRKAFGEKVVPKFVKIMSKTLSDNKENSGWLVGSKLTVADIVVFCMFADAESLFDKTAAEAFLEDAKLIAHSEKVAANSAIKAWIAKRPNNAF
ncbi:S-crystallin SL11-like [Mizuhopecten yessoensis]|uniref:S-crystallin SL11 n=1 Tax=Mizuhopecten yessoensis TaxID=6573 RepID=A0A210PPP2_MIZYE|nr:S-crystallin SL11-like [Mizuhopecten yessoensis]OWF38469.1 S-crystallin SL11 [Mizuhopecten yessoensis]